MIIDKSISPLKLFEEILQDAESHVLIMNDRFEVVTFNSNFYWLLLEMFEIQLINGKSFQDLTQNKRSDILDHWMLKMNTALKGFSIQEEQQFNNNDHLFVWKIYYKSTRVGDTRYLSMLMRDITAAKTVQHKLIEAESALRSMVNAVSSSVVLIDAEAKVADFNKKASDLFAFFNLELEKGLSIFQVPCPEPLREFIDCVGEALRTRREQMRVVEYNLNSGVQALKVKVIPLNTSNQFCCVLCIEEFAGPPADKVYRRHQKREMMRLNDELDQFVYSASHDLRAPLLSIKGIVNLIRLEAPATAYLDHIESSIVKLDNYVTSVINHSFNNRMKVTHERIDFRKLIGECYESLAYFHTNKRIHVLLEVDQSIDFYSDDHRIRMIIKSILANALQYFDSSKNPYVIIDISVNKHLSRIVIEDNGIGMTDEVLQHASEMFFRGTNRSSGAGLGLYIAKNIIDRLSGKIIIKSAAGVGTVVEIQLPNILSPKTDKLKF